MKIPNCREITGLIELDGQLRGYLLNLDSDLDLLHIAAAAVPL